MAIPITIPRLGWNMEEGVFVGWLKADGEQIRAGDALFSLEGEKATQDIECLDCGILRIAPDGPQPGDRLAVGSVIGYLVQSGEQAPFSPEIRKAPSRDLTKPLGTAVPAPAIPGTLAGREPSRGRPAISPRARRAAEALGVDWTQLRGSGRTGRIRERDVRAHVSATRGTETALRVLPQAAVQFPPGTAVAISPIRKAIADRMLTSVRSTAPVTLTTNVDATNLVGLRNQLKAQALAQKEIVPSYTDWFVKLAAAALQKHPLLNACWADDRILLPGGIHIGFAVETEAGLLVPVIRDVPNLNLRQLAARSLDLAERARRRRLRVEEMQGGTFTVTNLGSFGIDAFTPIINFPQCAVLGVGRIERRPVVVGDQLVGREQVTLSLTFDHRMVDGAPAARFLQFLSRIIENPGPSLMP